MKKNIRLVLIIFLGVALLNSALAAKNWNEALNVTQTKAKEETIAAKSCPWKPKGQLVFVNSAPLNCNPKHDFNLYYVAVMSGSLNTTEAYRRIAWAYEQGYGVKKNLSSAYVWYKMLEEKLGQHASNTVRTGLKALKAKLLPSKIIPLNTKAKELETALFYAYQKRLNQAIYGNE